MCVCVCVCVCVCSCVCDRILCCVSRGLLKELKRHEGDPHGFGNVFVVSVSDVVMNILEILGVCLKKMMKS